MVKSENNVFEQDAGVTDLERVVTATSVRAAGGCGKDGEGIVEVQTNLPSDRLPFSKARCVALVTTIAAAPFLSVSASPCVLGVD